VGKIEELEAQVAFLAQAVGLESWELEVKSARSIPKWYAAGGGVARMGPFPTQRSAWEGLLLTEDKRKSGPYPDDARIWPEWEA